MEFGNPKIRTEKETDFISVYELNKAAFGRSNESELVEALRKGSSFIPELSLVAIADNEIAGHILFTKIQIKDESGKSFESLALAPMAVKPGFQRSGIGARLINKGLEKARKLGYRSVIVLGHKHYYPKFGFVPAVRWNIKPPFDVPSNVFMGIELVPNALKNISGTVVYPKDFDLV